MQYTTFLGGNSDEKPANIAVDASGNAYIAGTTQSPDFPTTAGAFDRTGAAQNFAEAFVTKLNAAGNALVYSTFVGGSDMEFGAWMTLDAIQQRLRHRPDEVVQLPDDRRRIRSKPQHPAELPAVRRSTTPTTSSSSSTQPARRLAYSTYLGGTDWEAARGIAVDAMRQRVRGR